MHTFFRRGPMALLLLFISAPLVAGDIETSLKEQEVKKYKRTDLSLYLTPQEAYRLKTSRPDEVLLIDVRTRAEVEFVGSTGWADKNIPLLENDPSAWDEKDRSFNKKRNPKFVAELQQLLDSKGLDKNSPIIFFCRSGGRSASAVDVAAKLGFTQAYSIVDGFEGDTAKSGPQKGQRVVNGWKNQGLPWRY